DLKVVEGVNLLGRLQHPRTERHDPLVSSLELLDPEVEVDLLRRRPIRPVGRDMVGLKLNTDAWRTVDDHHVPVLLGIHGAVEHPGPEVALSRQVCRIEDDELIFYSHHVILSIVTMLPSYTSPTD